MNKVAILDKKEINKKFSGLRGASKTLGQSKARERIARLNKILNFLSDDKNVSEIESAVYSDFGKSNTEFRLTELTPILAHLKYVKRNLRSWMRDDRMPTPLVLFGSTSHIHYQAKGVVLIIAPWNYPFSLCIIPTIYAIAAGNAVAIKPSEITGHTSAFIYKMMTSLFKNEEVAIFEGDAEMAKTLLKLPFNHVHFTGSTANGKNVMTAAAKNLATVTLELGGKSPVYIDESVNLNIIVERLVWGKLINNGQTCLAPDYLLIQENLKDRFVSLFSKYTEKLFGYPPDELYKSKDLTRIVNSDHFNRLKSLIDDAVLKGAKIEIGGKLNEKELFIAPTLISNVTDNMQIMQEEIFGPILPFITVNSLEKVVEEMNKRPHPLANYVCSRKKSVREYIMKNSTAGGTLINDFLLNFGNHELPFGGVNESGIGIINGKQGYVEFSNTRGVMKQNLGLLKLIYPPYTSITKKLINFLKKLV